MSEKLLEEYEVYLQADAVLSRTKLRIGKDSNRLSSGERGRMRNLPGEFGSRRHRRPTLRTHFSQTLHSSVVSLERKCNLQKFCMLDFNPIIRVQDVFA